MILAWASPLHQISTRSALSRRCPARNREVWRPRWVRINFVSAPAVRNFAPTVPYDPLAEPGRLDAGCRGTAPPYAVREVVPIRPPLGLKFDRRCRCKRWGRRFGAFRGHYDDGFAEGASPAKARFVIGRSQFFSALTSHCYRHGFDK